MSPLPTKQVVCLACGAPREIEWRKPGETKYAVCQCGEIGIRVLIDGREFGEEPESRRKKANVKVYWER
jgi:hypothetical protein